MLKGLIDFRNGGKTYFQWSRNHDHFGLLNGLCMFGVRGQVHPYVVKVIIAKTVAKQTTVFIIIKLDVI